MLFDIVHTQRKHSDFHAGKIPGNYCYATGEKGNYFQLYNCRCIGSKHKLISWIFSIIETECEGDSFADIFAGTGIVAAEASKNLKKVSVNDFLYSNNIYRAFFSDEMFDNDKINSIIKIYNDVSEKELLKNCFLRYFGGKFFNVDAAKNWIYKRKY